MRITEKLALSATPGKIVFFREGIFLRLYNHSLMRWATVGQPLKVSARPMRCLQGEYCYSGGMPEASWVARYRVRGVSLPGGSARVDSWQETPWGYEGEVDGTVATSGPTPIVPGETPSVNPSAKPSIAVASQLTPHIPYMNFRSTQLYYTFSPNGGDLVDKSMLYVEGVNILTGAKRNIRSSTLGQGVTDIFCELNEVLSLTLEPINSLGVKGDRVTITTADLGLGPGGLGYCYNWDRVNAMPTPKVTFTSSDKQLFIGSELGATYTQFDTYKYPGMYDVSAVSWNDGPFVTVTTPGVVPPYTIQPADLGKPVSLRIRYEESDLNTVNRISSSVKDVEYSTDGFLSGIVIEP